MEITSQATKRFSRQLLLSLVAMLAIGCKGALDERVTTDPSTPNEVEDKIPANFDMNMYKLTDLVCDPFNNGGGASDPELGVKASLFWLDSSQPPYNTVSDYIEFGNASTEILFLSKIDVPTRLFDQGFPKETGDLLTDDQDNTLVEYFAMRFEGEIKLDEGEEEGEYEFAILSDDGAILRIDPSGSQTLTDVVNNDGNHPTRMGCGTDAKVTMASNTRLPFQMDYYQGPRYHISTILMWRKVDSSTPPDPHCGTQGNSRFFDFNNNSEPQQAYLDLLARGWKPLGAGNYAVKDQDSHNPCNNGQKPVITDFMVEEDLDGGLRVTWKTDIYATSQVRYVNLDTNEETLTESDNQLRKDHFVRIFPPKNVPLLIQAVSVSEDMGKSLSDPITMVWE